MTATLGQGSPSMASKVRCAERTSSKPCSALVSCTNSRTSAPAMNPEALPERITRPRSRCCRSACTCASSSTSVSRDSTLVEVPGLSKVSQAMPSASVTRVHADGAGPFIAGSGYRGLRRHGAAHIEIAKYRPVVREPHVGHLEVGHFDLFAHQHEIELDARNPRRKRGQILLIGAAQPGGAHEQVDLVRAPEGVEITGDDDRLVGFDDQVVQVAQLVLALAVFQRQMNQENADVIELELDDQPLDTRVEIVEAFAFDPRGGEEGIA